MGLVLDKGQLVNFFVSPVSSGMITWLCLAGGFRRNVQGFSHISGTSVALPLSFPKLGGGGLGGEISPQWISVSNNDIKNLYAVHGWQPPIRLNER